MMTKRKKHQVLPSGSKRGLIVAAVVGIWCLLWVFGIPQHSYYFVRCGGQLPVRVTSYGHLQSFASGWRPGYVLSIDPHYYNAPYLMYDHFFCTEQQAVAQGYSRDSGS